jgi:hypothetical protein
MTDPFVIGMCINLAGSVLINFGTNAIKYHHHLNAQYRRHSVTTASHSSLVTETNERNTSNTKNERRRKYLLCIEYALYTYTMHRIVIAMIAFMV